MPCTSTGSFVPGSLFEIGAAVYEHAFHGRWSELNEAVNQDQIVVHYVKPSSGWTLLHQAAFHNAPEEAKFLVQKVSPMCGNRVLLA